jgi:CRISPR-associated endonuclease/helicase Cas3
MPTTELTTELTADQFPAFVAQVHAGRQPFPWQTALLDRIVTDGRWPNGIDVPTGLGKTSILDVAVFTAALGIPAARRRVLYVVDRRLVVDEAHEHARRLADALHNPGDRPLIAAVAARLRMPDDDTVLEVTRMRGGVTWERTWIERPDRYAIVTGTVDQVGSRLLFRGYGVSERARSIDAALVGTDSLIVVDEAHLSGPFVATATAALATDATGPTPIGPRPVVVTMSATTTHDTAEVHAVTDADVAHPIAGARLTAAKRLSLVEVKTSKATADRDMAAALANIAATLAPQRVVGVVTNTVARARVVFELLRNQHDTVLLTGRSRQVDRDYLLDRYYPRIRVDRDRSHQTPLIVVATQTVEVGANIDFDALVSDSAPLPSLVQRLGRLNRIAACPQLLAPAIVVHDTTTSSDDPVYGPARLATWTWLSEWSTPTRYTPRYDPGQTTESLPASPTALRNLIDRIPAEQAAALRPAAPYVPVLTAATLDTWVRTAPAPEPDQPIEPFLHGTSDSPPPVTVVWRADLDNRTGWAGGAAAVNDLPPVTEEGIEISLPAVRRWLTDRAAEPAATDLDTTTGTPAEESQPGRPAIARVLRYVGRGDAQLVPPWQIRPGDTIVVPAPVGGCDEYGWHPTSTEPVVDVADLATRRSRPVLRLGPTLPAAVGLRHPDPLRLIHELIAQAALDADAGGGSVRIDAYQRLLAQMRSQLQPDPAGRPATTPFARVLDALLPRRFRVNIADDINNDIDEPSAEPTGRRFGLLTAQPGRLADDDTALGSSTGATRPVGLDAHQRAVADRAHQFATNLALPDRLVASVTAAARWHDEGKRDPRFQVMLHNGDTIAAEIADQPLAKSGMDPANRAAFTQARQTAGYPVDMRHEALSAHIAARRLTTANRDVDPQLVQHLVASHHGWGRPLLPPVVDPAPVKVDLAELGIFDSADTVDWQQPHRFTTLNTAYGRWGLALLEAIVRLADIWCSARDEQDQQTEAET